MNYLSKIEIVSHDKRWNQIFDQESIQIRNVLGKHIQAIYHIGSTAIPNMPAKPIIDMMLACDNLHDIDVITEKLTMLGYGMMRRQIIPHCSFITHKQLDNVAFNLHLHERGSPQICRHVNFRDYLTHHPGLAQNYAKLKENLAVTFANDRMSYVLGKDKLVQAIDAKAKRWQERKRDFPKSNTGIPTNQWSDRQIVEATESNLNVHMTHFAQYLDQVEFIRKPGFTLVNSSLSDDTFNYILDGDFSKDEANTKITEVVSYFKQNKIPYSWWVGPTENISDFLTNYSFKNAENNIAMYLDLDAWKDDSKLMPELEIRQAKDEKTLRDFALVLANDKTAFEKYFSWVATVLTDEDPIEYYVGYVDNKPVVRGLSCYFGQVVGLYWLSTAPDERKKGYGTAMQQFRLRRAKVLGYHIAVLQASNEGYALYKKLGYKECGVFREFKFF